MKWYKFIIWFQLFMTAFFLAWVGVTYLRGTIYGMTDGQATSELLYTNYPALKHADIVHGIVSILIAVSALFVRSELSKLKKGSPKKYMILLIFIAVEPIIYRMFASFIAQGAIISNTYSMTMYSFLFLIINYVYFRKRTCFFNK